ncbi:MAG: hypothetical protein K8L97_31115 [Anaerolineae bacterium]|nr:hypothetical protein [Anaerolineae bacterium]
MSWYHKEAVTPFDHTPIEGLFFMDGSLINQHLPLFQMVEMKCPLILFPSGSVFQIDWDREQSPHLQLFPGLTLPLFDEYITALQHAHEQVEDAWFSVFGNGIDQLELWASETEEVYFVQYDNLAKRVVDVTVWAA